MLASLPPLRGIIRSSYGIQITLGVQILSTLSNISQIDHVNRMNFSSSSDDKKSIKIPENRLEFNYVRSSGPGGQHVNKTNSCVELKFSVEQATWLPRDIRDRLITQQAHRITKDGVLMITSQKERSQYRNRLDCLSKLQEMIDYASVAPKERVIQHGLTEEEKLRRLDERKHRSELKSKRKISRKEFEL